MPELSLYRNPDIAYVPRLDLQVAGRSLATMEQNHLKTLELQGELESAVNALELDESENAYKQGLIDDIKSSVENATINGYSGNALSDIIKKKGDISGNTLLLGKVKANAAHKKYIADTQARTDITQDTKDMFIEDNPYNLGKTDADGNILEPGTYDWTPKSTAVEDVPISKIFAEAVQIVSPEMSQWDTVTYVNKDGSTSPTIGMDTVGYMDSKGKVTKLSREKLLDAVNAIINSNQTYRASINQAFKVQEWKLKNGRIPKEAYEAGVVPGVDKSGNPTSMDEYLKASIDPFLNAKAYEYKDVTKKYNPLTAGQLAALNGNRGYNDLYAGGADGRNFPGNNVSLAYKDLTNDYRAVASNFAVNLRNTLTAPKDKGGFGVSNEDLGLSADKIGIPADYQTIENAILKSYDTTNINDLPDEAVNFLVRTKQNYLKYKDIINSYNNILSGDNTENSVRCLDTLVQLGQDISQYATSENKTVRDIVNARKDAIDFAFFNPYTGNPSNSIRMSYDNSADLEHAFNILAGGRDSALAAGYRIDGNSIVLDYENRGLVEQFANLFTNNKGHFYREGDDTKVDGNVFDYSLSRNSLTRKYTKKQLFNNFTKGSQAIRTAYGAQFYDDVANREYFVETPSTVVGGSVPEYTMRTVLTDPTLDKDTRAAYASALKQTEDITYRGLTSGTGITNMDIWVYNEDTNSYEQMKYDSKNASKSRQKKADLQTRIEQAGANNIKYDLMLVPGVGWRPHCTIYAPQPEDDKNGNQKQRKVLDRFFINNDDVFGDTALVRLNNDSRIKSLNAVVAARHSNTPIALSEGPGYTTSAIYNPSIGKWQLATNNIVDENRFIDEDILVKQHQAYNIVVDAYPEVRANYIQLRREFPNEDINTLKKTAYINGIALKHPELNWGLTRNDKGQIEDVDENVFNLFNYILFEY